LIPQYFNTGHAAEGGWGSTHHRGIAMNKQQIKGAANEAAGKLQKNVGKATANGTLQVKGAARELAGKAEKAIGNAKSDMKAKSDARNQRNQDAKRAARQAS
jgi:uncharacterized protein YjbJ (UPF0337 family)